MRETTCTFRHPHRGEKSQVCKHWLKGLCQKSDQCKFLHEYDMSKMQPCQFMQEFGQCTNPDCPYLHTSKDEFQRDCPWYERGFCRHGPNCRQGKHVRRMACPDYLAGFCIRGPGCAYGHPNFNIQPSAVARAPGGAIELETVMKMQQVICANCSKPGHIVAECPLPTRDSTLRNKKLRPLHRVQCFKCGKMGHYANSCPNERAKPPPGGYKLPSQLR